MADLRQTRLSNARFKDADLSEADLRGTDLSEAHLPEGMERRDCQGFSCEPDSDNPYTEAKALKGLT